MTYDGEGRFLRLNALVSSVIQPNDQCAPSGCRNDSPAVIVKDPATAGLSGTGRLPRGKTTRPFHSPGLGHDSVDIHHAGFDVLHALLDARLPAERGVGPFFRRNARIADARPTAPSGRRAALSGTAHGTRRRLRRPRGGDPAGAALNPRSRNRVDPVICRRPAADLWLVAGMVRSGEGRCCSNSPPRRRRAKTR